MGHLVSARRADEAKFEIRRARPFARLTRASVGRRHDEVEQHREHELRDGSFDTPVLRTDAALTAGRQSTMWCPSPDADKQPRKIKVRASATLFVSRASATSARACSSTELVRGYIVTEPSDRRSLQQSCP